jgi:host factor-I protein
VETNNKKTMRPPMAEAKEGGLRRPPVKKPVPPDQTNAENFYYLKQMQGKTPMVVVLKDGEILNGYIEWYDKQCLKFNREEGPNLLLYKHNIKYMYKAV